MLRRLVREPLVHFLLLGAALFGLDAVLPGASPSREILVTEGRIRSLAEAYRLTWQRPPTKAQLEVIIEDFVREEVMVREALAEGLDRDDVAVRRRLQQKMQMQIEEPAMSAEPTDKELADFLAARAERFATAPRITFSQEPVGARLSMVEPRYEDAAQGDIARVFGREFAAALLELPMGEWAGPVASGYGMHRVRVEKVSPGAMPPLEAIRPLVEREWREARRKAVSEDAYLRQRARYTVKVDKR